VNAEQLIQTLSTLSLSQIRYFLSIGSTNTEARNWAEAGAPDLSLVVTDEQTEGRGRMGRTWYTPAGSALAFSLVLNPYNMGFGQNQSDDSECSFSSNLLRLTALGALAVCKALQEGYGLPAKIKWPNDVLINGRKIAGILVEATWEGHRLRFVILGIGVNITQKSLPAEIKLDFPATCVESVLGKQVERVDLIYTILKHLLTWRKRVDTAEFMHTWENNLAFMGEKVIVVSPGGANSVGVIIGLSPEGLLKLHLSNGEIMYLKSGDVSLRPVNQVDT
jgi:BirA family transcriptional regulator, biotin operon repressor / biotin---[acetyl-CoA-carboxylase] ligase